MITESNGFPKIVKIPFAIELATIEAVNAFEEREKAWLKQHDFPNIDERTDIHKNVPRTIKLNIVISLETAAAAKIFEESLRPILNSNEDLGKVDVVTLLEALQPVVQAGGHISFAN